MPQHCRVIKGVKVIHMSTPSHFSLKFKTHGWKSWGLQEVSISLPGVNDQAFPGRHLAARPSSQRRLDLWSVSFSTLRGGVSTVTRQHQQLTAVRGQPATPSPVDPVTDGAIGTSGSKREASWPRSLSHLRLPLPPPPFCSLLFFLLIF